jgi:hypothetical protein
LISAAAISRVHSANANRHAFGEFWARAPADALGVKQEFEKAVNKGA